MVIDRVTQQLICRLNHRSGDIKYFESLLEYMSKGSIV